MRIVGYVILGLLSLTLLATAGVTVWVEREAPYARENLGGDSTGLRALILYHPSRDAHFSEELTLAAADGFKAAGYQVDRATLTTRTPARPEGYALIAVVSNTFYGIPDLPTLRYLRRARFDGLKVLGLMAGAGSTERSEQRLATELRNTGAIDVETRSFWIMRPNDETRMKEPNRAVARDLARRMAHDAASALTVSAAQ